MEKLVAELAEKLGLPADQVGKVVEGVIDHLKKNPEQAASLLGGKLGGLLNR